MPDIFALLKVLYAIDGSILFLMYLPQFIAVWKDRQGAPTISLLTWGLWLWSSIVTATYAHFIAKDLLFTMMSFGNMAGCGGVFFLTILRRHQFRRLTG